MCWCSGAPAASGTPSLAAIADWVSSPLRTANTMSEGFTFRSSGVEHGRQAARGQEVIEQLDDVVGRRPVGVSFGELGVQCG